MEETLNIFKEFHAMPSEEKVNECSKDPNGSCKLYTSAENYKKDAVHYWKDTLSHPCPASGENMEYWPQKPYKYRYILCIYEYFHFLIAFIYSSYITWIQFLLASVKVITWYFFFTI